MIRLDDVTKRYGSTLALDHLSLRVPVNSVFGLLGPNGAGKTTLLRLIMGFAFPDGGTVDRGGLAPAKIGYLPERAFYPAQFAVGDYLSTLGRLAGLTKSELKPTVERLLLQVNLDSVVDQRLATCSRGMLQRLGLAQALLNAPPLLLLDEPALGLDPSGQKFMRQQIAALHQDGRTVILSSHHLDEVTRVCTHVAVLSQGRLVRMGALDTILAPQAQVIITTSPIPAELALRLLALDADISVTDQELVLAGDAVSEKAQVLRLLLESGVDIQQLVERHSTLEEVYLEATGG
jgi:ABC-2 type transport system ATP-binding protein